MLQNVGLVVVGQNFPIQQIRASDFEFNHRKLTEELRLPMVVRMTDRGVTVQALPDRFEVVVSDSMNFAADIPRVANTAAKIFEYVGPRSITAIGHNAQVKVSGTNGRKLIAYSDLLGLAEAERLLGSPATNADLALYFVTAAGHQGKLTVMSQADPEGLVLDFNINVDTSELSSQQIKEAVSAFADSQNEINQISDRVEAFLNVGSSK